MKKNRPNATGNNDQKGTGKPESQHERENPGKIDPTWREPGHPDPTEPKPQKNDPTRINPDWNDPDKIDPTRPENTADPEQEGQSEAREGSNENYRDTSAGFQKDKNAE